MTSMLATLASHFGIPFEFYKALFLGTGVMAMLFTMTWWLSREMNNWSFVDIAWSYGLTVLLPLYLGLVHGHSPRRMVVLGMGLAWSLRLGTHLLFRIARHHPKEDVRYKSLRKKWAGPSMPVKFFGFFQAQALLILLLSIPMLLVMRHGAPRISLFEWLAVGVWLVGFVGEGVADWQMKRFKADPTNRGKVCKVGLWRYSRHPNYFFESVIWVGFWLLACATPWGWVTVYAPALMLYFLLRVTGIPLTEKCSIESKGDAYREYQRTTSAFIPWFPKHQATTPS
jgi:steroid 5-alpha reductase family enzyme